MNVNVLIFQKHFVQKQTKQFAQKQCHIHPPKEISTVLTYFKSYACI